MAEEFTEDLPFGVMTSSMPFLNTEDAAELCASVGAQEVEICALDEGGLRSQDAADHVGSHLPVYQFRENPRGVAKKFADTFNKHRLGVTLGNYDRIHSGNPEDDRKVLDYNLSVIDFAAALGGRNGGAFGVNVGFFWGMDRTKGMEENLDAIADKVYVLAKYAEEDRGVTLSTENCHMPGGWPSKNEQQLPQQVNRSAGSTLAARLYVTHKLLERGIKPETLALIWDPSHPETEYADPCVEADLSFGHPLERLVGLHLKGHNHKRPGNEKRMAYFGGPAMPGWFAQAGTPFYEVLKKLGVPIGDNSWAQQYGEVTYPGNEYCTTPVLEIIRMARKAGFGGRVIGEDETATKGKAVAEKDSATIAQRHKNCLEYVKPAIWRGNSYDGRPFKEMDVNRDGVFKTPMTWDQAVEKYKIPA